MNRILILPSDLPGATFPPPEGRVTLAGRRARHLAETLRVSAGASVRVGLLNGPTGVGIVSDVSPECVVLDCTFDEPAPPPGRIDLVLAMPRPKAMKRLWAPLAMLGVGRVAIINATKVERNYFDTHWLSPEQFEPLLIEGLEQAGDTRLPTVSIHRRFRPFIEDLVPAQFAEHLKVVAHPAGGDAAGVIRDNGRRVLLAVGPEGGWTAFELDALGAAGFRALSLGRRTLRTDVACIGLLAVLDAALQMNMEDSQQ